MSIRDFILTTVGVEARRVSKVYAGSQDVVARFLEAVNAVTDQNPPREIQFRWWKSSGVCSGQIYQISHPSTQILPGPGAEAGQYIPDGFIPETQGLDFQIVVYFWDDHIGNLAVTGGPGRRNNQAAIDHAAGALVIQ